VGLDAVVYKNRRNLGLGSHEKAVQVIADTGEVFFEDDEISRRYRARRHASERRLGNITEIAELFSYDYKVSRRSER